MVRLHYRSIGYFVDRKLGSPPQNLRQCTFVLGIKMLHQHECHSGFLRQIV